MTPSPSRPRRPHPATDVACLTTEEVLDMIDRVINDVDPWEPNTPPATPETPVPHS